MKYLKKFENFPGDNYTLDVKSKGELNIPDGQTFDPLSLIDGDDTIYSDKWKSLLPDEMTINYNGDEFSFKKGNIMLVGDLVEISYDSKPENPWGHPDCLEFDLYFVKDSNTNKLRIDIDITYGNFVACEFSIEAPNIVHVIQHTTYHSKFDPSNTVFALEDKSLDNFIKFLNRFDGFKLTRNDLRFLDKYDNWKD